MKRYLQNILFLFCLLLMVSCSDEQTKTQNEIALRPVVPSVLNNEVQIGTQIWMTKNLNVSRYRNGDVIPQVQDPTQWLNLTTGAWCYCDNNSANGAIYGKLYNWYAVNDPRGLAPIGYHVPTDGEWTTLTMFLGGVSLAGGKMKTMNLWNSPNTNATNSSGFSGLPGGSYWGNFPSTAGSLGYWWSSSQSSTTYAWCRYLYYNNSSTTRDYNPKTEGFSVRCIKD